MNQDILNKLIKARVALIIDQPFFGNLALRLKLTVMPPEMEAAMKAKGMKPTLAVDGVRVFYNERFIDDLDFSLVKSALAHEVGHCVFDHIGRRGARDSLTWNIAGDFIINATLKEAGFELGQGWLYDPKYNGWTTDQVYASFPPGKGNGPGNDPLCDILDGTQDPSEIVDQQNDWKVATIQAANAARQEGKLSASLSRFVEELVETKTDWRDRLRRFITERAKDEYSWARPNRRFLSAGLYLPTLYSETMGTIAVVSDDSGSITNEVLALFGSEIASIRDAVRPRETIVMSCDAEVNHVETLEADDPLKLQNHGGGGTDFRPPFKWLEERSIRPACLVYLTDGHGTFPSAPPDYPVLWCCITSVVAPWGETVRIDD